MSATNSIAQMERQILSLEMEKKRLETEIAKHQKNAKNNLARENKAAAMQKAKLFLMKKKRVEQLDGMIRNLQVMINAMRKTNRVSAALSRPLMKMSAANEAALDAELNAMMRNAAKTPSAEHAAYVMNMRRGLENAAAAAPAVTSVAVVENMGPEPKAGTPAYYEWIMKKNPYVPSSIPLSSAMGNMGSTMIPVRGMPPQVGKGTRKSRRGRRTTRRRLLRRRA